MNRRDPNSSNRQAGGHRNDDRSWDSPRQANQWQSDSSRQAGGGWDSDSNERTDYFSQDRELEGRYVGDPRDAEQRRSRQDEQWAAGRERGYRGSYGAGSYGASSYERAYGERGYGERGRGERGGQYGNQYDRGHYDRGGRQGPRREGTHAFDASGGNDYGSFTSEDFGGRDFSATRGGGMTGGLHPSDSYRPSYGPGSWGRSSRDYDDRGRDRGYDEDRGFFQRAGDEVASWFGDEDAARRRAADHRGRGPSDYTRSDERIREDVNDTLTHDWRLDASHVRVTVKSGEVTLEGTVDNRYDKRRAEDLADDVSGVRHVQNNLRVQVAAGQSGLTAGAGASGYSHTATTGTSTSGTSGTSASGTGTGTGTGTVGKTS